MTEYLEGRLDCACMKRATEDLNFLGGQILPECSAEDEVRIDGPLASF